MSSSNMTSEGDAADNETFRSMQLTMQLQPASLMQPQEESRQHLHMSLLPDFHLNVKATSLLGSRAKLQGELRYIPERQDVQLI